MKVDKNFCMNSFLMFRTIVDNEKAFSKKFNPQKFIPNKNRYGVKTEEDVDKAIKSILKNKIDEKTGIMLSGGIDSAILASYVPRGTKAYTLKCIADGAIDETVRAKEFADEYGLDHHIIEVYWEDYLEYSPLLMKKKGMPIHSIEPQIYKAALRAKEDGIERLIFGESADAVFGGLDGLLSREWKLNEFAERYTFVNPKNVLKDSNLILEPYERYSTDGYVDTYKFISEFFFSESVASYVNACELADVEFIAPFVNMKLEIPLDLEKIRSGENKYLLRSLFKRLYPGYKIAPKTPMPRPMTQWLSDYSGPKRDDFLPSSAIGLNGDQKWLIYILEWFLNIVDEPKLK